jgi:hypothetical protein
MSEQFLRFDSAVNLKTVDDLGVALLTAVFALLLFCTVAGR